MMEWLLALGSIMLVNVVLSGDNAVVIALASRNLPEKQRKTAVLVGSGGAIVLRVLLTLVAVALLRISYIQFFGGVLLIWIAAKLLMESREEDEAIHVQVNQSQVVFRRPDFELRSKVVDGKFPDWQRVIPVGHDKAFDIERQRLSQSLTRAAILTNDKYRGVRIALTSGSLRIACSNNEQEEAQEELDIDYTGEPLDIGFNVQYLQDALNNLEGESVNCSFGDPTSSMLISVPGDENFRYVVMPMRI